MTTENTAQASSNGSKWVERFGTLVDLVVRKDKKGADYVTFGIKTPKFTQRGIAFGETAAKIIAAGAEQSVWMKGPMSYKTVQVNGEDKQVGDFTAIYFNVRAPKAAAEATAEQASEQADEIVAEETAESAFA